MLEFEITIIAPSSLKIVSSITSLVEIDLKKVVPDLPDEAPFVAAEKGMVAE